MACSGKPWRRLGVLGVYDYECSEEQLISILDTSAARAGLYGLASTQCVETFSVHARENC